MKNLWKKWIFIVQFHFQDPDPEPDSEYGSEYSLAIWIQIRSWIRIRNTGTYYYLVLDMCIDRLGHVLFRNVIQRSIEEAKKIVGMLETDFTNAPKPKKSKWE